MSVNKEIEVLSDFEHVLRKPTIYVGSVEPSEERVPIIKSGLIVEEIKMLSVGFYKILNEAIDNAFDEAKRQSGKIKHITVEFSSKDNSATIIDTGGGFKNAERVHPKSGMSMVETAVSMLRAGSNFNNDGIEENIVGTNGMGISLTNMLSSMFSIETVNPQITYTQVWENFSSKTKEHRPTKKGTDTGTTIKFIPRKDVFKGAKWDKEYIITQMAFRKWILSFDPVLKDVPFIVKWDGKEINLPKTFMPKDAMVVSHKVGTVCVYPKFPSSIRASFVNATQASSTGQRQVHELVMHEMLNEILGYEQAHNFYETVITLNVPPKIMRFGDQNKTRFVTTRDELMPFIEPLIKKLKREFSKSDLELKIKKAIEEYQHKGELKKIRTAKRDNTIKFSEKYFPAGKKKNRIFLCEGLSAAGSLAQKRDKEGDAVYALRGKVKNTQTLSDLTSNQEIMDLINILGLDIEKETCDFKQIIIATDQDVDGEHIASLLLNLFYRWFPYIIRQKKLGILVKPLISYETDGRKGRHYAYSIDQYKKIVASGKKTRNVRYLKGLGSNDIQDWEWIFNNIDIQLFREDSQALRYLDIAFGPSAQRRKDWLQTIPSYE
jgi:DNA gyrase/topoisomerase IV subunit B